MATLKEIAEKAGVSAAAASTALSGKPGTIGISSATRERVQRIARESGYRPNPLAASLRTGRTGNIALCLPRADAYLAHPQGAGKFWTLCEVAAGYGYHISILVPGAGDIDPRTMDGCLAMGNIVGPMADQVEKLATDIPVVSMNTSIPGTMAVHEDPSWTTCRDQAAAYLYDLGHRRLAITHMNDEDAQVTIPNQFEKVAREIGIDVAFSAFGEEGLNRRYPSIDKLLAMDPLPTAVFAIDDDYANALITRLFREGVHVPDDVSVFSGSTTPEPNGMVPHLTGLLLHFEVEVRELIGRFVEIIEGKSKPETLHLHSFNVELIERDSCAALSPA